MHKIEAKYLVYGGTAGLIIFVLLTPIISRLSGDNTLDRGTKDELPPVGLVSGDLGEGGEPARENGSGGQENNCTRIGENDALTLWAATYMVNGHVWQGDPVYVNGELVMVGSERWEELAPYMQLGYEVCSSE